MAEVITKKATDELEELISMSPSLSLEDTVRIRLIEAKDMRTVVASLEDGGYRYDPDLQVVDVVDLLGGISVMTSTHPLHYTTVLYTKT